MEDIKMYRVRYIPQEEVDISEDEILFLDKDRMITRWDPIHPRQDFAKGFSCTFLKRGYKISKVMNRMRELKYWYCDIIQIEVHNHVYRFIDLLLDVKIMPDGQIIVMDMDELAFAIEKGLISQEQANRSLRQCDELLKAIYSKKIIDEVEDYFRRYCE